MMLGVTLSIRGLLACVCILTFQDKTTANGQHTLKYTTMNSAATANIHDCPFMLITPSQQYADYGKKVRFSGVIEAKLEFPTDARWQKVRNGNDVHNLDLDDEKYSGSDGLSSPLLVINTVDFDDAGDYRLQVKVSTGWCSSNTVSVPHVYGILQYNAVCKHSRECDERKQLRCSITNTCLCHSSYYPYTQICYWKPDLRVSISTSSISASRIQFQWSHPSHSNLIDDYTVSIRHNNGTNITGTTVGKQTSYNYHYQFVPGYRYYFRITSNVKIPNPSEQFSEYRESNIVLAPLPPGLIDQHNSSFHPEKLHLKWAKPPNNTRVEYYSITISNPSLSYSPSSLLSWNEILVTNHRFQPGTNYTVTIRSRSHGTYSQPHTEEFQTLRTPFLTITPYGWPNIPYLSDLVILCTVVNNTDYPRTLETKWRRNQINVNISDSMYTGSSVDMYKPKLVINRIDFDQDDDDVYQCAARNSEGWGTSERTLRVDVVGSIQFQQQCNRSRECLYGASFVCSSQQCLCHPSYYHKDQICHQLNNLRARSVTLNGSTCGIFIRWDPPYRDADLITAYEVFLQEYTNGWRSFDKVSVGNTTHYSTPCNLESGRLHQFFIRSKINLHNPVKQMFVDSSSLQHIVEPRKPGRILSSLSNFSADGLRLVWEESDAFVNRYMVEIDGHQQTTLDSKPEIDWNRLLLPVTQYNVTITAISYGYVTNYPSYGSRESLPVRFLIETDCDNYGGEHPCPEACSCVINHTDYCDPISARCLCLTGWTGDNCSQDVDECQGHLIQCDTSRYQVCVNSPGSARCECLYGGLNLTNCKHPKPPVKPDQSEIKVSTETTFDIHINREEFLNNTEKWEKEFKSSLMKFYKDENVRGLIDIIILSIRQHMPDISEQAAEYNGVTALVINYEIIGSKKNSSEMKSDLASSMQSLVSGKINITVFDKTPAVKSVAIKDPTRGTVNNITRSSTPCMVLKGIGGSCPVGQICEDSIGIATCISSPAQALSESLILVIALGISIPTTILLIAVFIACLCRHGKSHKEDNHLENRIGKLEAKISKNPYSQEPTSRPEYETPYDSVHSSEDDSHVYMELEDVPGPPPCGRAGVDYVNYMKNPRYENHARGAKRY